MWKRITTRGPTVLMLATTVVFAGIVLLALAGVGPAEAIDTHGLCAGPDV